MIQCVDGKCDSVEVKLRPILETRIWSTFLEKCYPEGQPTDVRWWPIPLLAVLNCLIVAACVRESNAGRLRCARFTFLCPSQ